MIKIFLNKTGTLPVFPVVVLQVATEKLGSVPNFPLKLPEIETNIFTKVCENGI
jgi:hypothetical protein